MVDLSSLQPGAYRAAMKLLTAFPNALITSARRLVDDQCRAMAEDIAQEASGGHLDWVARTYKDTPVEEAVQTWIYTHPSLALDPVATEAGLLGVLATFPPEQLNQLSWHLSGQAWDVQPSDNPAEIDYLKSLVDQHVAAGGKATLLLREGGLVRWHFQCDDVPILSV